MWFTAWRKECTVELLKVDTIEEAMEKLLGCAAGAVSLDLEGSCRTGLPLETEEVPIFGLLGRVLAEDVVSLEAVPGFNRSTVDGYAVRSCDTGGASESMPAFLRVIGEVEMGCDASELTVGPGECVYVPTGGMVPEGADAMVMVEYCEAFGAAAGGAAVGGAAAGEAAADGAAVDGSGACGASSGDASRSGAGLQMAVYSSVSAGNNMVMAGDDIACGQVVLRRGRKVRPADMGVLSSMGRTSALVYKPWKIVILSTGDEVINPKHVPMPGQVRDVNTYGLYGQAVEYGFDVLGFQVVEDDAAVLEQRVALAMKQADLVVVSGGSSQGKKDATAAIIGRLASSGVLTHGLAVKPGKPTILGFDEPSRTALIGLPGHPVAAMILFREIVGSLWDILTGQRDTEKKPSVEGIITANIAASPGRKTWQLVKVDFDRRPVAPEGNGGSDESHGAWLPAVTPIWGKSGLIRTLSEADGYIIMDVNDEGVGSGQQVTVWLLG